MAGGMGELIMTKRLKNVFYGLFAAALTVSLGVLAAVNLPVRAQENAGTFAMETGAEIRLEEPSGLRFITKVDQAFIDGLEEANPEAEITFGTEIVPAGREDVDPLDIPQTVWAEESTETVKCFKAVLTKIPDTQYLTKLTATAYYAVDGAKTYVSNPQTRSVAYVASAALAAGQEDPVYTSIVDKAVPAISLGEDFSLNVGGEKTLAVTGGEDLVVKFSTDNDAVATVDENGVVRAVGAGTANITATLGSRTDSVSVTVENLKKLFYSFEDGTVGEEYDSTKFTTNSNGTNCFVTEVVLGAADGTKSLAFNFDGINDGGPTIVIKNQVIQDFYNAFGSMSFTLANNGSKFHEGYYETPSGAFRHDIAAKSAKEITVPEAHMKELVDNDMDLVFVVNNTGGTALYEGARFEYYLDSIHAPNLDKTVEKNTVFTADEMLGNNAELKSFAVYKGGALVSEEGAESYTFTENGEYTVECVQSIEGYEDSTVKGTVRVIDAVFDNVEDWYGEGKLIQAINAYTAPVSEEYRGTNMFRMDSEGWWPRFELNKAMVEEFLSEGKTFTLLFRLSDIDGEHKTYVGQSAPHVSIVSGEEFAELTITPEKWEEIKGHADFASVIPVVTVARYEYGTGADGSDPFTMYLAGYKLS